MPRAAASDKACHDLRMRVPQNHRSPRADVIDVAIAVEVEQIRPFAARKEDRLAANAAERRAPDYSRRRASAFGTLEGGVAFDAWHAVSIVQIELQSSGDSTELGR